MAFNESKFKDFTTLVIIYYRICGNIGQQWTLEVVTIEVSLSKQTFNINEKYTK